MHLPVGNKNTKGLWGPAALSGISVMWQRKINPLSDKEPSASSSTHVSKLGVWWRLPPSWLLETLGHEVEMRKYNLVLGSLEGCMKFFPAVKEKEKRAFQFCCWEGERYVRNLTKWDIVPRRWDFQVRIQSIRYWEKIKVRTNSTVGHETIGLSQTDI